MDDGLKVKKNKLKGKEDMEEDEELSFTDIVALLITNDENIDMKTDIPNPKSITGLHILSKELKGNFQMQINPSILF